MAKRTKLSQVLRTGQVNMTTVGYLFVVLLLTWAWHPGAPWKWKCYVTGLEKATHNYMWLGAWERHQTVRIMFCLAPSSSYKSMHGYARAAKIKTGGEYVTSQNTAECTTLTLRSEGLEVSWSLLYHHCCFSFLSLWPPHSKSCCQCS